MFQHAVRRPVVTRGTRWILFSTEDIYNSMAARGSFHDARFVALAQKELSNANSYVI
jgi:hypothetical protein